MDNPLTLVWRREPAKYEYLYGSTKTRFSAQIGKSANAGRFMWMIFHDDFRYCVYGQESSSIQDAQIQAQEWIVSNATTTT